MAGHLRIAAGGEAEADLLDAMKRGDGRAFETVMRRHNRRLFRIARSILKDEGEAEEAVQDAYLRAFTHLDQCADGDRLGGWLARIAANEALMRLRKRGRVRLFADGLEAEEEGAAAVVPLWTAASTPEELFAVAELRRLVEQAIDDLPDGFRAVFVMRAVEQMSVQETAACLGIPPETVKTRLHRARALLQKALSDHLDRLVPTAFGFAGERCDRIVAGVLARLRD
ncbi:RNA polymerase sigma factor [Azospirillum sp. TSO22-1]|uniref:RNA polymerase sigma factor n=1 Tax=Azospirillum sp. TSO22-1 TaxID=716789 RepID=UPI00130497C2|nr:RNA polymerase sigma factor [Azospirillum sp. TSO22-1]